MNFRYISGNSSKGLSMEKIALTNWPNHWPSPEVFLGPVVADIASVHRFSAMMEHQVTIRFKNNFGIKISQISFHQGLYEVAVLKFYGSHHKKYHLVKNPFIPKTLWCFKNSEILAMCEEVARWESRSVES